MIYTNSLHYARTYNGSGFLNTGRVQHLNNKGMFMNIHFSDQIKNTTSYPVGYFLDSIFMPFANGGISGRMTTNIDTTSNILGDGYIEGTLTIIISTSGTGDLLANINGTLTIVISVSGAITAYGYLSGDLNIGASPSADDIAQAVWQMQLPGGFSSGSAGILLGAVGVGADPWQTVLPGTYTGDQAGKILADLETLIKQVKALTAAGL